MKGRRRQICDIVIFNVFVHEVATVFKIGIAQTSVTNVKLPGWTVQCLALGWGHCPGSSRFPSRTHLPPRGWGGARGAGVSCTGAWRFLLDLSMPFLRATFVIALVAVLLHFLQLLLDRGRALEFTPRAGARAPCSRRCIAKAYE